MKSENDNICSICLEELKLYQIKRLKCNHSFHINCINKWKIKKNICPICRKQIDINERKNKSCLNPLELFLLISFLILFISFSGFMILRSIEKLKLKKKGKLTNKKPNNKYQNYFGLNFFFDLISVKKEERIKILKEYGKNTPDMIKYKIENFFDNIVEGFNDFIEGIHEFNELRKHWNDR